MPHCGTPHKKTAWANVSQQMNARIFGFAILLGGLGQAGLSQVTITGQIRTPTGQPWVGELRIRSQMMVCGNVVMPPTDQRIVVDGTLNLSIQPTDVCGGGFSYQVYYIRYGRTMHVANWVVPSSPTTTTVDAVQVDDVPRRNLTVRLAQLGDVGPAGSVIMSTGSSWAVGTVLADPTSAAGDMIYREASGGLARLAVGAPGQVLASDGIAPQWTDQVAGGTANYGQVFSSATSVAMAHNAGTRDVIVDCYDAAGVEMIPASVTVVDPNTVTVSFAEPTSGRCVVNSSGGGGGGSGGAAVWGSITGTLQNQVDLAQALDARAPAAHSHSLADVTQSGAAIGQVPKWTGTAWAPAADEVGQTAVWGSITGTISNQADLQSALSGKSDAVHVHSADDITSGVMAVSRLASGTPSASTYLRGDGTWAPVTATVYTGQGLAGSATQEDPVRIDPNGGVASQAMYQATIDFGAVSPGSCAEQNIAAAGVSAGATIAAGWPTSLPMGVFGMMYAGSDVVVIRLCNVTAASVDPPAATYGARIVGGF